MPKIIPVTNARVPGRPKVDIILDGPGPDGVLDTPPGFIQIGETPGRVPVTEGHVTASSISVSKGMRGEYGWEIKVYQTETQSLIDVLKEVARLDAQCRKTFGSLAPIVHKKEGA